MPSRVVLQDFTGVPAVVDLAAMRDAMAALGGDPAQVNPLVPADLVIDHSVQIDAWGGAGSFAFNVGKRVRAQRRALPAPALGADRVPRPAGRAARDRDHPPGQPRVPRDGRHATAPTRTAASPTPDTLVGTDSHTTMINGLGVLGYGVGGIEAEAVLLGQPLYQPMPRIVGVRLHGELPRTTTATDLVLVITEMLRAFGVVGAFVEFAGDGLAGLSLADRATISNMSPEFGATSDAVPDRRRDARVPAPDRPDARSASTSWSATRRPRACGASPATGPEFDAQLELDLGTVEPSLAGPRRPQDRVALSGLRRELPARLPADRGRRRPGRSRRAATRRRTSGTARSRSRRSRRARTRPTRR